MNPLLLTIVAFGGLLSIGMLTYGIISSRGSSSVVQERLGRYAETNIQAVATQASPTPKPRQSPLGERLNEALRNLSFFSKVQDNLNAADLKLNVGEFFAFAAITTIAGVLLGVIVTVFPDCSGSQLGFLQCLLTRSYVDALVLAIVGGGAGAFVPNFYVGFKKGSRLKAFDGQLGDTLNLLVNALRSGYSILQAMEAVGKELPPPISVEFKRVVQEIQLGLPMETALEHLLARISSEDLDLVVTAINIQREVGGNLAEILDVISFTIRERIRIKGEIATLTSQGMATGYAITGMPFALMLLLWFVNRPYINEFFSKQNNTPIPCGWMMLILALIMIAVGGA
ncbi:MAG: type II secretion system F family protein, partial [Chloroflexi bacterium]|nr:type II secretion system F family protein [Chloroflexota bacterium]